MLSVWIGWPGDFDVFVRNVNANFSSNAHARMSAIGKSGIIAVTNSFITHAGATMVALSMTISHTSRAT